MHNYCGHLCMCIYITSRLVISLKELLESAGDEKKLKVKNKNMLCYFFTFLLLFVDAFALQSSIFYLIESQLPENLVYKVISRSKSC